METLLTTGQMLDELKIGQVAVRIFEPIGTCTDSWTKVKLEEDGDLMFYIDHRDDWTYERLTNEIIKSKWKIIR